MSLGYLLIIFIVMIVISIILISSLYLIKNQKVKKLIFYLLVIWSLVITLINFTSLPSNYLSSRIIALLFGSLAIISIFIKAKNVKLSYLLATASTILGLLDIFFF